MPPPEQPSRQVLDETPGRVLTFLLAVVRYPVIATLLRTKGYDQAENDYAWERLSTLGRVIDAPAPPGAADEAVSAAIAELDAWDEPNFAIIEATLRRRHPEHLAAIFADLEPKQGPEAVGSVLTLLERLDKLEKNTSAGAKAAMKLLATRGYAKPERQRLRGLVDTAKTISTEGATATDNEREQARMELHGWFGEWSAIAKKTISRRQHLIALGLASPRKPESKKKPKAEKAAPKPEAEKPAPNGG